MRLKTKEVLLDASGSKKIVVTEAGWDYSFRFSETEKAIATYLTDNNYNKTFKFFCQNLYPMLASGVVRGEVPSPPEAFAMEGMYLNNWYLSFWELNEDIIGRPYTKTINHEQVVFKDGTSVVVWEAQGLPSFTLKLIELEYAATDHPLEDDPEGQLFVSLYYPKMAASCNGSRDIPDAMTVRNWPRTEINKWIAASQKMNPDWWLLAEEQKQEAAQQKRKKPRRRSGG
jgi:hypothetical protein